MFLKIQYGMCGKKALYLADVLFLFKYRLLFRLVLLNRHLWLKFVAEQQFVIWHLAPTGTYDQTGWWAVFTHPVVAFLHYHSLCLAHQHTTLKLQLKWYSLHSQRVLSPNSHPKVSPFFLQTETILVHWVICEIESCEYMIQQNILGGGCTALAQSWSTRHPHPEEKR